MIMIMTTWLLLIAQLNLVSWLYVPALHVSETASFSRQSAQPSRACYYYRLAAVEISSRSAPTPAIRLIEVWQQGDYMRIKDDHSNQYYSDATRAIFVSDRTAWQVRSDLRESLLYAAGLAFAFASSVSANPFIDRKPDYIELVDGRECAVYRVSFAQVAQELEHFLGMEIAFEGNVVFHYWVPQKSEQVPLGYVRGRIVFSSSEGYSLMELRVLEYKLLSPRKQSFFAPSSQVDPKELSAEELEQIKEDKFKAFLSVSEKE